jgi:phosphate transport system substrate-binding protein
MGIPGSFAARPKARTRWKQGSQRFTASFAMPPVEMKASVGCVWVVPGTARQICPRQVSERQLARPLLVSGGLGGGSFSVTTLQAEIRGRDRTGELTVLSPDFFSRVSCLVGVPNPWTARRTPDGARCVTSKLLWYRVVAWLMMALALLPTACKPQQTLSANVGVTAQAIENKGSDTLVNLALAWAELYMQAHPEVCISVTGGGTGTGIAAMINGTVSIANASREMKQEEIAAAEANGITPVEFVVSRDAIAVVVNPSNPVQGLTLRQISGIYSGKITNWQQVGGDDRPIVLLSRESNSGTYVYFLENVIRMGDNKSDLLFSPDTLLMPSSEGISVEVRQNPNAIGYDGLGYVTEDQKVLAVAKNPGDPHVLPAVQTVNDGSYPISRPLYMYTAGQPTGQVRSYVDWVLSGGQTLVTKLGFVPLQ